jgi:hypothetical protein
LSALQETLIGCGRLKYTNELTSQEGDHKVTKALKLQKSSLSDSFSARRMTCEECPSGPNNPQQLFQIQKIGKYQPIGTNVK